MSLTTIKSYPWIIGLIVVFALAGITAGTMLVGSAASPDSESMVNYVGPSSGDSDESSLPETTSTATYTRFPQVRLNQQSRADLVGSDTLASISNRVVSPQQTDGVVPTQVTISPEEDWNSIFSQHTFTISVAGEAGAPADGVEVEVFLNRFGEAVGDVVSLGGENPRKVDNLFGRVMTDANGQATLTITSTRPGDTDVTAFVPQIADDNAHKVFAVKHWVDMRVEFPPDAINLVGTDHPMLLRISKVSDGSPISDVQVSWAIIDDDPVATIDDAQNAVTTTTNENGESSVTLRQVAPGIGDNQVLIQVLEEGTGKTMFGHTVTKQWQSPTLEVDKQGPDNVGLRKTAEYSVTVTNSGDTTATDVTLTDELPAGLTLVSSDPVAGSSDGSTITWSLGDIAPSGSVTVTMVLSADAIGDQINTATAVSVEGITGQDTTLTSVIPGSISLAKTAPAEIIVGDNLTYEITATNDGEGGLTDIVVRDTLPSSLTYVSSNPEATVGADGTVSWLISTLDAGMSSTMSVVATTGVAGEVVNSTTAEASEGASASAQATTLVTMSEIGIIKTVDNAERLLGQSSVFTIEVSNSGNATASNVLVVDSLPASFQQVSSTPEGSVADDGNWQWTIASIEAGGTESITLNATASEAGSFTNSATATERGVTVSADATVNVLQPAVSLTKTGGSIMYVDGERDYVITATNTGTANLTDVTITDNIPAEMSYVSSDSNGAEADGVVTWSIGNLDVGSSVAVALRLRGESVGEVINTASVTSAEGAGADAVFNISIVAAAAAHLSIIDGVDPLGVGESGSYTVTITNQSSDSALTNVRLSVTVPSQLTIVSAPSGSISGGTVTYAAIESLAAGEEQTFTIEVRADQAGDVVASATLRYDEFSQPITAQEGTTIVDR